VLTKLYVKINIANGRAKIMFVIYRYKNSSSSGLSPTTMITSLAETGGEGGDATAFAISPTISESF
jgi:hypothetical protein